MAVTIGKAATIVFLLINMLSLLLTILFLNSGHTMKDAAYKPQVIQHEESQIVPDIITILGWTKMTAKTSWRKDGPMTCVGVTCLYTEDHSLYNSSEAVIVRPNRLVEERISLAPHFRFPWQKWIAVEQEPPPLVWFQHKKENIRFVGQKGFYNITALPVKDSDVPWIHRPRNWTLDERRYKQLENTSFVGNKTKLVAWFVSHCKTASDRETYVKQLQKYIPVDIYGKCGQLKCKLPDKPGKGYMYSERCDQDILQPNYKFYLSFENSLCEDYVTEKLTRIYSRPIDIVPIVAGHVNYSQLLPNGSYIDVRDFKSEKDLADYLLFLDKTPSRYNEYVRRKRSSIPVPVPDNFCHLCQYLHAHRNKTEIVDDIVELYGLTRRCITPRRFFEQHSSNSSIYRNYFHTAWG